MPSDDDEQVALVDAQGAVVGVAGRREVRRANLLHSATAVVVRDPLGRIYVHRRSAEKDFAPSYHDAASGGVLLHGETPEHAALRELAEELGIEGVRLEPLPGVLYEDESVRCRLHAFETTYDGPVRHVDGEVVWGAWMTLAELADHLHRDDWLFVPDTRALLRTLAAAGIGDYGELGLDAPAQEGAGR